jgi:DNA primase large subunit
LVEVADASAVNIDTASDLPSSDINDSVDLIVDASEENGAAIATENDVVEIVENEIEVSVQLGVEIVEEIVDDIVDDMSAQEVLSNVVEVALAADALENEAASDVILDDVAMMADTNIDEAVEATTDADADALTPFKPESDNEHK